MGNIANKLLSNQGSTANADMPMWLLVVMEYCDWDVRCRLTFLSKQWKTNAQTAAFFRFLCDRLANERGIYVPSTLPTRYNWKTLFLQLFTLRDLWQSGETMSKLEALETHKESWKIQVFAKFRPLTKESEENEEKDCQGVTLPLHQRLAMIKMNRKIKNNRDALKVLTQEGGWFQAKWQSLENDKENEKETNQPSSFYTDMKSKRLPRQMRETAANAVPNKIVSKVMSCDALFGRVVMMTPDTGLREFSFDSVLPASASQRTSYDTCVKPLVVDMLNGYNATAVVYGQTGSGKTYSMFGQSEGKGDSRGIIPRACEEILSAMQQRFAQNDIESVLKVSYVEVFGDQVSDLLRYGERCGQSKVSAQRYVLSGAAEHLVQSMDDVYDVLKRGDAQKRRAATAMNERSTRAHSLFIVTLRQSKGDSEVTLQSRLFLADLGGSEQVKKSLVDAGKQREGAENNFSVGFEKGLRMREAVYINLGLLALKKCVEALNNHSLYVPYQDSKLTMLLSEGLGGNSKTSIIVCNNLHPTHAVETLATLRFGETCAHIELEARNNATMLQSVLDSLDKQIAGLEEEILKKERWIVTERRRDDLLAEEGTFEKASGATEVMKVSVVTGAEKERQMLDKLLSQRAALVGSTAHLPGEEEKVQGEKKVVGFGREYAELYGLGAGYNAEQEGSAENSRFSAMAKAEELPTVFRNMRKARLGWAEGTGGQGETAEQVRKVVSKVNRSGLKEALYALQTRFSNFGSLAHQTDFTLTLKIIKGLTKMDQSQAQGVSSSSQSMIQSGVDVVEQKDGEEGVRIVKTMADHHEELWHLREPDVNRAHKQVTESFWPTIREEIKNIDAKCENFNEQIIPLELTHRLLKSELKHQKEASMSIDPSAAVALSKVLEMFVMEFTLHTYNSPTLNTGSQWNLTKEDLIAAIKRNELYDFLVDHTT